MRKGNVAEQHVADRVAVQCGDSADCTLLKLLAGKEPVSVCAARPKKNRTD